MHKNEHVCQINAVEHKKQKELQEKKTLRKGISKFIRLISYKACTKPSSEHKKLNKHNAIKSNL